MTGSMRMTSYKRARPSLLLDDIDLSASARSTPSVKALQTKKTSKRCPSSLYVSVVSVCGSQVVLQIGHLLSPASCQSQRPRSPSSSPLASRPKTCFFLKVSPHRKMCVPQASLSLDDQLELQLDRQSEQDSDMRKVVNGFPFFPRINGPEECVCIQNRYPHVDLSQFAEWKHVHTYLPIVQIYYLFLHGCVHNDIAERNVIVINVERPTRLICGGMQVLVEAGLHLSLIDFGEMTKHASMVVLEESALADLRVLFCLLNNHLGYYKFIPVAEFRCPLIEMVGRSMSSVVSMMLRALSVNFVIQ